MNAYERFAKAQLVCWGSFISAAVALLMMAIVEGGLLSAIRSVTTKEGFVDSSYFVFVMMAYVLWPNIKLAFGVSIPLYLANLYIENAQFKMSKYLLRFILPMMVTLLIYLIVAAITQEWISFLLFMAMPNFVYNLFFCFFCAQYLKKLSMTAMFRDNIQD